MGSPLWTSSDDGDGTVVAPALLAGLARNVDPLFVMIAVAILWCDVKFTNQLKMTKVKFFILFLCCLVRVFV
jgi:hypothetical protein